METNTRKTWKEWLGGFLREALIFIGLIVFVVIPFRIFIAQPYLVSGGSMDPTFKDGEYLIVDQLSYRLREPKRGEVIVFRYPKNPKDFFIKRVIGLPGEQVIIEEGRVSIKTTSGETISLNEPFVLFAKNNDNQTYNIGIDEYFVMGDNRIGSADSRYWGNLPKENIVGRPAISLFPINKIGVFPGDYSKNITEENATK